MGLAAKAFLTGFMKEAGTQIKEENERLENYALTRANQLIKEIDEFDEEKKKYTAELRQQARDLSMFIASANPELSRTQVEQRVSGILLKGQGKRVIEMFEGAQKSGKVTRQMADIFKPDENIKETGRNIVEETLQKMTTGVKVPGRGTGFMPDRTAFGLKSDIYRSTMEQAAGTRNLTLDEFAVKRLPTIEELGEPPRGSFDMSVFEEEADAPTKDKVMARFAKSIYEAGSVEEKRALEKERDNYLRAFPKDEKEKALTFSNALTGFRTAIQQAVNRNTTKLGGAEFLLGSDGSVQFRGTAEQQKVFNQLKVDALKNATARYANASGVVPEEIANALNMMGVTVGKDNIPVFESAAGPATKPKATVTSRGGKFYVRADGKEIEFNTRADAVAAANEYNK